MSSYRDKNYIIEDIILNLVEYSQLKLTELISFSGLNLKKHRCIIDELELNGLIRKSQFLKRNRVVTIYRPTQLGIGFCRSILEPYEKMFPRKKQQRYIVNNNNNNYDDNNTSNNCHKEQKEFPIIGITKSIQR